MKISAIRPLVLGTPWRNLTYVIVETDEGLSGVGEVRLEAWHIRVLAADYWPDYPPLR